jgi:hypothetical protein
VAPGCVHEELERVEGAAGRRSDRAGLRRLLLGAHDHVALLERGLDRGQLVVGELVLVREGLELLLVDEAALGGLLDEALGRGQIMQVNRVAQFRSLSVVVGPQRRGLRGVGCAGMRPATAIALSEL